ncbi:MAG TPA: PQQ-dependent sugar dehydrogenase [Verrucomicrobiota bacterium]|nr:copper oxidase [Verrucomicrobiales bacterium]HRI13441.1 PQQ-dependent sugar dehydrogenase [Verrucomicrobiota bacterium]
MLRRFGLLAVSLWCLRASSESPPTAPELAASINRGRVMYQANCSMCHEVNGRGVPGTYPPLAESDFLRQHLRESVLALVEGLKRPITVNERLYHGQMPAVALNDPQVADVMNFVLNSWNNPGGIVTAEEVRAIRAKSAFPTYEALAAANAYKPLPAAPDGFTLREVIRLNDFATRLAGDGTGMSCYVLGQNGAVWKLDLATKKLTQTLWPTNYPSTAAGEFQTLGFTLDTQRRLWITMNQRVEGGPLVSNIVSIYRTSATNSENDPVVPKLWFQTSYPYGIGPYNHGISDIRFGPDGMLYVSSGSRTDGGEKGTDPALGQMGEVDLTATLWRLDPKSESPQVEIVARGIRNAYSFAWDDQGHLFTVSNGPDAHAGEEMDALVVPKPGESPRHHGFPYQLGLRPAAEKWYPHTPDAPAGASFVLPVANLGPDGWRGPLPGSTFDPHSSPAGLVWLGNDFPAAARDCFVMGRFGNLIKTGDEGDSGFDLLTVRPRQRPDGSWEATVKTLLAPMARPIDLLPVGRGRLLILEYTRPTTFKDQVGWLPGRILELEAKPEAR